VSCDLLYSIQFSHLHCEQDHQKFRLVITAALKIERWTYAKHVHMLCHELNKIETRWNDLYTFEAHWGRSVDSLSIRAKVHVTAILCSDLSAEWQKIICYYRHTKSNWKNLRPSSPNIEEVEWILYPCKNEHENKTSVKHVRQNWTTLPRYLNNFEYRTIAEMVAPRWR
jgi:hypothetical protein